MLPLLKRAEREEAVVFTGEQAETNEGLPPATSSHTRLTTRALQLLRAWNPSFRKIRNKTSACSLSLSGRVAAASGLFNSEVRKCRKRESRPWAESDSAFSVPPPVFDDSGIMP